ncbi:hypothetical protein C5S42_03600, partial [Candidatus Methanomarinus sp.]
MYDKNLETTGLLLTVEIYNRIEELQVDDLLTVLRKHYWDTREKNVKRPIDVTIRDMQELCA